MTKEALQVKKLVQSSISHMLVEPVFKQRISQGPIRQTEPLPAIQRGNLMQGTLTMVLEELKSQGKRK